MTPQKLIEEYQAKIAGIDKEIASLNQYHAERRDAGDEAGMRYARFENSAKQALRQAYFQFTKDLEDLA